MPEDIFGFRRYFFWRKVAVFLMVLLAISLFFVFNTYNRLTECAAGLVQVTTTTVPTTTIFASPYEFKANEVWVDLGEEQVSHGLYQQDPFDWDGKTATAEIDGRDYRVVLNPGSGTGYMYFMIDDGFVSGGRNSVQVEVSYLDNDDGSFSIEYDSFGDLEEDNFRLGCEIIKTGTNTLKVYTCNLTDAEFLNSQAGYDFRLYSEANGEDYIDRVVVRKITTLQI
jgi:hypothetical protein